MAAAARRPRLPAAEPGDLGDLSARVDVQGDHHRRGPCRPVRRRTLQLPAAARIPLPDSTATLENYGGTSCGSGPTASLRDAFAKSCNTAFVQLGIDTGADALRTTAQAFGLDASPPPIPLQVAESTVGPISDAAALGMSSIGQKDVALTPLQNALVAATIANGGVTMQPYLVDSLKGPDLANIATTMPHELRRAVSAQVADYTYGPDDRRRAGDAAEGSHRRRADRIQDGHRRARHRSAQHPAARVVHRVRAGRAHQRSRSRCWWRMAATDCRPPAARWPRRSAGPPSPRRCGRDHERPRLPRVRIAARHERGPERVGVEASSPEGDRE